MRTQKEIVRLRKREISGGQKSLYLDIYYKGKRKYEYLNLYLIPEKNKQDRQKNIETRNLAIAVQSKRIVEIQNNIYGFDDGSRAQIGFLEYFRKLRDKKTKSGTSSNWHNWNSVYMHLTNYCDEATTFDDITQEWVEGFKEHLEKTRLICQNDVDFTGNEKAILKLSQNTKLIYFQKLNSCFNQAIKDGIIKNNPADNIPNFKKNESERIFLTADEVKILIATPCEVPVLKRAFLFSCLTGIRKSDVMKLKWKAVSKVSGYTRITFRQTKTRGLLYQDINSQAEQFLGQRTTPEDLVFDGFRYNSGTSLILQRWALSAGISKKITFHSSRHTFVVLMLTVGTDFYTVSKLVGHKNISTTMEYAHILDTKRREAISSMPDLTSKG